MLEFTVTLDVVLPTGEVPHEVTPVHEVTLVAEEETDILELAGHLDHHRLATAVVGYLRAVDTSHP